MVLEARNIDQVVFCRYIFETWYGCLGYFDATRIIKGTSGVPSSLGDLNSSLSNSNSFGAEAISEPPSIKHQTEHAIKDENMTGLWDLKRNGKSAVKSALDLLHVCRFCFKYTVFADDLISHEVLCSRRDGPPGVLVYKSPDYCIYKVDGAVEKLYCQCLCLFGKLFLDSKSIYFAVDGFQFYVLTENTQLPKTLGFFSKEKVSWDDYNLACILVFPPFQRQGLGKLLIAYSYYLSTQDDKLGGPERPLSKHGRTSYLNYWLTCIVQTLVKWKSPTISVDELAEKTYIHPNDIVDALRSIDALTSSGENPHEIIISVLGQWVIKYKVLLTPVIDVGFCID